MQEVGEIMHLAGSGRVIVELTERLADGQILCDKNGAKVAKVVEVIGPVKKPFASAAPLTNNINRYVGSAVFASEPPARTKNRRKRN